MTFSFSEALDDDVSKVRWMLGDTVDEGHLVEDETITALAAAMPSLPLAAAAAADGLAAKFGAKLNRSIGKVRLEVQKRAESFRKLADRLRTEGGGTFPGDASSGGISVGGTALPRLFRIGDDDNPPASGGWLDDECSW